MYQFVRLLLAADSAHAVWLGLQFYPSLTADEAGFSGRPQDVGYRWDDGTLLDGNKLGLSTNEPVRNNHADTFILYTSKLINDIPATVASKCMCQADFDDPEDWHI